MPTARSPWSLAMDSKKASIGCWRWCSSSCSVTTRVPLSSASTVPGAITWMRSACSAMPGVMRTTGRCAPSTSKSASMLGWVGPAWNSTTNAKPVPSGTPAKKRRKASSPPADVPMATTSRGDDGTSTPNAADAPMVRVACGRRDAIAVPWNGGAQSGVCLDCNRTRRRDNKECRATLSRPLQWHKRDRTVRLGLVTRGSRCRLVRLVTKR